MERFVEVERPDDLAPPEAGPGDRHYARDAPDSEVVGTLDAIRRLVERSV